MGRGLLAVVAVRYHGHWYQTASTCLRHTITERQRTTGKMLAVYRGSREWLSRPGPFRRVAGVDARRDLKFLLHFIAITRDCNRQRNRSWRITCTRHESSYIEPETACRKLAIVTPLVMGYKDNRGSVTGVACVERSLNNMCSIKFGCSAHEGLIARYRLLEECSPNALTEAWGNSARRLST